MQIKKITPFSAILITINIIIGAGFFINLNILPRLVGIWGFLNYLLGAVILLPIVLCMAELAVLNPVPGGIYVYAKKYLHPGAGFMSGWSYFMAKATTIAVLVNAFITFFRGMVPALQTIPHLILCCGVITMLIALNMFGITIGGAVQYLFISMKMVPILCICGASIAAFNSTFLDFNPALLSNFLIALPVVVFAFLSFEVVCSIAHLIENPEKNIRRIMLTAFCFVSIVYTIIQFGVFAALGPVASQSDKPVLALGLVVLPQFPTLALAVTVVIFASIMAGAFGVLTSNCWNLFALAKDDLLPGKNILTRLNKYNVPWVCLSIEAIISMAILAICQDQIALQNMAVFSVCIAYVLSALAALYAKKIEKMMRVPLIIPVVALMSCSYLMMLCIKKVWGSGLSVAFLSLFMVGVVAAMWQQCCKHK